MGTFPDVIKALFGDQATSESKADSGTIDCVSTPLGNLTIEAIGEKLLVIVTPQSPNVDLSIESSAWALQDDAYVMLCKSNGDARVGVRQAIEAINACGDDAEWNEETPDWVLSIAKMARAILPPEVVIIRTPEARGNSARGLRFEAEIMTDRATTLRDNAMKLLREAATLAVQAEANLDRAKLIENTEDVVRQARAHGLDLANVGHIERITDDLQLTTDKLGAANEVLARARSKMHETLRKLTMPDLRAMVAEECGITPTVRDSREQLIDRLIAARFGEGSLAKAA